MYIYRYIYPGPVSVIYTLVRIHVPNFTDKGGLVTNIIKIRGLWEKGVFFVKYLSEIWKKGCFFVKYFNEIWKKGSGVSAKYIRGIWEKGYILVARKDDISMPLVSC